MTDKNKQLLMKALLVLGIIALGVFVYLSRNTSGNIPSSGSSSTSFVPYIPIYVAIFIPLIAKKKMDKGEEVDNKKLLIMFFVLFILASLGILLFRSVS